MRYVADIGNGMSISIWAKSKKEATEKARVTLEETGHSLVKLTGPYYETSRKKQFCDFGTVDMGQCAR